MFSQSLILLIMLSRIGSAADRDDKPLPTIAVTDPKDIAQVDAVNDAMSALSQKVTACVNAGGKPETCRYKYPQDLTRLKTSYNTLIKERPAWKDQMLSYRYVNKEGRNISGILVLPNLRRQLEAIGCE